MQIERNRVQSVSSVEGVDTETRVCFNDVGKAKPAQDVTFMHCTTNMLQFITAQSDVTHVSALALTVTRAFLVPSVTIFATFPATTK